VVLVVPLAEAMEVVVEVLLVPLQPQIVVEQAMLEDDLVPGGGGGGGAASTSTGTSSSRGLGGAGGSGLIYVYQQ
jgi:hypothetical protein